MPRIVVTAEDGLPCEGTNIRLEHSLSVFGCWSTLGVTSSVLNFDTIKLVKTAVLGAVQ